MTEKKRKKQSAAPFFMMAIFAYLAGFPIWLVAILVLVGFLVRKLGKDNNALKKLPLPKDRPSSAEDSPQSETPMSRMERKIARQLEQLANKRAQELESERESELDIAAEVSPAVPASKPVPVDIAPQRSAPIDSLSSAVNRTGRVHPFARGLRTRDGARQAIIAMTILGRPRSTDPYQFEPSQRSELGGTRSS